MQRFTLFIYPPKISMIKAKAGVAWGGKRGRGTDIGVSLVGKSLRPEKGRLGLRRRWWGLGGLSNSFLYWSSWQRRKSGSGGWSHRHRHYDFCTLNWTVSGCCWGYRCCPCCPALWHYSGCLWSGRHHLLSIRHWFPWGRSHSGSTQPKRFQFVTALEMVGRWRWMV